MRLLFSSIHWHLDPSSGAAMCARELLELLAARGIDCRVLTTGILDPERETSLDEVLATLELPVQRFQAEQRPGGSAEVIDQGVNGVRVTLMPGLESCGTVARPPGGDDLPRAGRAGLRPVQAPSAADVRRASGQPRVDAAGAVGGWGRNAPAAPAL